MKIVLLLVLGICYALLQFKIPSSSQVFKKSEYQELASVPPGTYRVFAVDKDRQGNVVHITLDSSEVTGTAIMLGFDCSPELGEKIVRAKIIKIK